MKQDFDEFFMHRALELASQGRGWVEPNPMVGAVIVRPDLTEASGLLSTVGGKSTASKKGQYGAPVVVGQGYHARFGEDHAEQVALKNAGDLAQGATLYVTLEPCCHVGKTPPCTDAIIKAGIARVVIAMQDPFDQVAGKGIKQLKKAGIEVKVGVLKQHSQELNLPFITRLTKGRPWIIGKWAMTLDGKMATRTGSSYWISNEESRQKLHQIRSGTDAIMIGSRTAMEDDPRLTVRLPEGEISRRVPTRIVFDSGGTISVFSELALTVREVPLLLVFGPDTPKEKVTFWESKGAEVVVLNFPTHKQRLIMLMELLAKRGMTNILVEGGGKLLGHLFDLEYLDEAYVFVAPKIVGGENAVVPVGGLGHDLMKKATQLLRTKIETIGTDVLISGRLDYSLS